jgi:hypothetical protein
MATNESIKYELQQRGWLVDDSPAPQSDRTTAVSFQKTLGDSVDVVVSVHPDGERFQIWSRVSHRAAAPVDTLELGANSLERAFLACRAICEDWESAS